MKRKVLLITLFGLLLIIGIFQFKNWIVKEKDKKDLKHSSTLFFLPAKVNFFSTVPRSHQVVAYYSFYFLGNEYTNNRKLVKKNRAIPQTPLNILIAVDTLNPKINFALFTLEDFRYYNKPTPDSLFWIMEYFR